MIITKVDPLKWIIYFAYHNCIYAETVQHGGFITGIEYT